MVRRDTRSVGFDAERLADRFLQGNGLTEVARNFRCRLGEIDLIMNDNGCLVFVEVRFRSSNRFSRARLSVDIHKQRKIIRTAALFIGKHARYANSVVRFDVVAIDADDHGEQSIEWLQDAFRPSDSRL
ncbi:MAG: YraN family protein [Gammaproteobacteria bacterium]|nr:YraN family protein [Gammaproteobacteria bacterium]MDH3748982.1 YraN family protein [Gammaproteobacteria bacterium]MDH3804782.1 YraN family protein [Gammaproteobacteria bacterium]